MKNQAVPIQGDFCWIEGVLYDNRSDKQVQVTNENLEVNRFCKEILNSCLGDNVAGISFEVDPETDDCVISLNGYLQGNASSFIGVQMKRFQDTLLF